MEESEPEDTTKEEPINAEYSREYEAKTKSQSTDTTSPSSSSYYSPPKRNGKKIAAVIVIIIVLAAAIFLLLPTKCDVTVDIKGSGYVDGIGTYNEGDRVTLTATGSYGFTFKYWQEDGQRISNSDTYTFIASEDRDITAYFERNTYKITTSANYPNAGDVAGGGQYLYEDTARLTASVDYGYTFGGWYSGGELLSTSTHYSFEVVDNVTVEARYSIIHDASFTVSGSLSPGNTITFDSKYDVEISSSTWTFTDVIYGGQPSLSSTLKGLLSANFTADEPCAVKISRTVRYSDGYTDTDTKTVVVDGTVKKHYEWDYWTKGSFLGIEYDKKKGMTWDIPYRFSWYYEYFSKDIPRGYTPAKAVLGEFVTSNDPIIRAMAQGLMNYADGMSDYERVSCLLGFVQSFPYEYDSDRYGGEYYRFPAETLWEGKGDCEDFSILFCALAEAMGYDTVQFRVACYESDGTLIAYHMAPGILLPDTYGTYVPVNGKNYTYCEPTTDNMLKIGEKPSGYEIIKTYTYRRGRYIQTHPKLGTGARNPIIRLRNRTYSFSTP